jgi:hypothetical protein
MLAERANILRSLSFEDVVQSNAKNKKEKSEDEFLQVRRIEGWSEGWSEATAKAPHCLRT